MNETSGEHLRIAHLLGERSRALPETFYGEEDYWLAVTEPLAEELAELRESRFAWAAEADRLDVALAARHGFPPDWERQLAACQSSGAGVDLVRSWLGGEVQ